MNGGLEVRQRRGTRTRSIQPDGFSMEEHRYTPSIDRERAYRYLITEATGCLSETVGVDAHIIDWEYYGRVHTWTVVDGNAEIIGTMTGTYVDKGAVVEGRYLTFGSESARS